MIIPTCGYPLIWVQIPVLPLFLLGQLFYFPIFFLLPKFVLARFFSFHFSGSHQQPHVFQFLTTFNRSMSGSNLLMQQCPVRSLGFHGFLFLLVRYQQNITVGAGRLFAKLQHRWDRGDHRDRGAYSPPSTSTCSSFQIYPLLWDS